LQVLFSVIFLPVSPPLARRRCGLPAVVWWAGQIEHRESSIKHRASGIEYPASSIQYREAFNQNCIYRREKTRNLQNDAARHPERGKAESKDLAANGN